MTRLRQVLVAGRYDIVDSAVLEADLASRLATVRLDTAHITHLINLTHDARARPHDRARHVWTPAAARAVDRITGRLTVRFVAITHAVAHSAQRTLGIPADKITVVERGVDARRFGMQPPPGGPVLRVLAVGRLEPQKDHATGVLAIDELRRRGIDATLDDRRSWSARTGARADDRRPRARRSRQPRRTGERCRTALRRTRRVLVSVALGRTRQHGDRGHGKWPARRRDRPRRIARGARRSRAIRARGRHAAVRGRARAPQGAVRGRDRRRCRTRCGNGRSNGSIRRRRPAD